MGNMAKAKNIAMGTVTASSGTVLTIPAFGFNPDHVAVFTEDGSTGANIVISIFDGHVNYIKTQLTSTLMYYRSTINIENAVSENGVTYTISSELRTGFAGTYRYVAWQE